MAGLQCKHCGTEKSYADANIADVRGETCSENTRKEVTWVDGARMTATIEKQHEWVEVGAHPAW